MMRALGRQTTDPASARMLWARIDHAAVDQAPWASLVNLSGSASVSKRASNYQHNPEFGILLDQLWVR